MYTHSHKAREHVCGPVFRLVHKLHYAWVMSEKISSVIIKRSETGEMEGDARPSPCPDERDGVGKLKSKMDARHVSCSLFMNGP